MEKYKVMLTRRAVRDLDDIFSYIAYEKQSPENAKGQTDRIRHALQSLDTFPQSHQERQVGRYANQGYRQLLTDDYIAIYRINEEQRIVLVLTIQYQGRDL